MYLEDTPQRVRDWSRQQRESGHIVGFIPTMGALHDGHLSLVSTARKAGADRIVVSIFVNPTQFGPEEDLAAYPRDLAGDMARLSALDVDLVFQPTAEMIYPAGSQTTVALSHLPHRLCGLDRPVHFAGVATVVSLLFNIVEPTLAVFGEKDFQQLQIIRQLVKDLYYDVQVISAPIIREADGLAMSSRNVYLEPDERQRALCLWESLKLAQRLVSSGVVSASELVQQMITHLTAFDADIQYVKIVDESTLEDVNTVSGTARALVAARFGSTRLIDNMRLDSTWGSEPP